MTDDTRRLAQAGSFGSAAGAYERGRPSYPAAALEWLIPAGAHRVVDVGAGTGKLTRLLRRRGLDVVAVEPSAGMRDQLGRAVPGVPVLPGSAEDIPLPAGSADLVVFAQAWHWADPVRAVPEAARILAPAGHIGMLWNVRDERVDWVAALGRILHRGDEVPADYAPAPGPPFGPPERYTTAWRQEVSPQALLDLVSSRSYVITLPPGQRAALLREVRGLLRTHPALAGADRICLPYLTLCTRARLGS